MVIRHMCFQASCFEPTHLVYGTHSENCYDDKIANGTLRIGSSHYRASITEEVAREIKASKPTTRQGQEGHVTRQQRAQRFGVSEELVRSIDRGHTWAHLSSETTEASAQRRAKQRAQRSRSKARIWTTEMYTNALRRLKVKLTISPDSNQHVSTPCHLRTGSTNAQGYGLISVYGKLMLTHVLACEIKLERHLEGRERVRHLCGVRSCCAPDHLEPGSARENSLDILVHGTHRNAKLTAVIVREIRATHGQDGLTKGQRARKYNISPANLRMVILGKTWRHVA